MPELNVSTKSELDTEFTIEEIIQVIKSFPSGKAAGPDGFGGEFDKAFCNTLATLLHRLITNSKENIILPRSIYEANICLLLKKGKEETDPANFRPIALQKFHREVIAKVLANRLNRHVTSIIHPDQTGFIPGRLPFSNVRRLLNTLYADHQKANQIEWPYIFQLLNRFGFGESFISWVKMLFACQTASISTNSDKSSLIALQRSVQQGCPSHRCSSPFP